MAPVAARSPLRIGRYALHGELASGGMATVHFGRLLGPSGFARTVAIKRLHPHLAKDPEFVAMFLDEARLAARVRHPNVVPTLDVVALEGELFLVMEYVRGESLSRLTKAARHDEEEIPLSIVSAVIAGMLHGLHAAHEATNERGEPLDLVHRDVSPQNVLVGVDGISRVLDFGIAKAVGRSTTTRDGRLRGKLAYMAPEQLRKGIVDRRTDIHAAGVMLWELLTAQRLFESDSEGETITRVLEAPIDPPSKHRRDVSRELDDITLRALAKNPADRFGTARQMARAIESCIPSASPAQVGELVERLATDALRDRDRLVADIETIEPLVAFDTGDAKAIDVPSVPEPPRRSRLGLAFVAGLLVAGLSVLGIGLFSRSTTVTPTVTNEGGQREAMPSIVLPARATETKPLPPSAVVASVVLSASSPPSSSGAVSGSTNGSTKLVHAAPPPRPAQASATPPCTVKSFVDGAGVKHYVNDCPKKP